jgi:hypothetical protein
VLEWHARTYPGERPPARRTLYRFVEDQPERWFVPKLGLDQTDMARVPPRIRVLEQQANLIETQTLRLNKALQRENAVDGPLSPEIRVNIELLDRLLHRHLVAQQDLGLEPKVTPGARKLGADDGGDQPDNPATRTLAALVSRVVDLPEDAFMPTLVALIGPPPVKQPLVLEGEAVELERRPLPPDDLR